MHMAFDVMFKGPRPDIPAAREAVSASSQDVGANGIWGFGARDSSGAQRAECERSFGRHGGRSKGG
jgi:hypothetical protein